MKAEADLEVMEDAKEEWAKPVKDGDEISIGYLEGGYLCCGQRKKVEW